MSEAGSLPDSCVCCPQALQKYHRVCRAAKVVRQEDLILAAEAAVLVGITAINEVLPIQTCRPKLLSLQRRLPAPSPLKNIMGEVKLTFNHVGGRAFLKRHRREPCELHALHFRQ